MKAKLISHQKTALMCQFKPAWVALAAAAGLICVGSAQAQNVTGQANLSNVPPGMTSVYPDWSAANNSDTATGFQVTAADTGGGSGYYQIPVINRQILNTSDTEAVLTFTVNDGNTRGTMWVGVPVILNDNVGAYTVGGYCGMYGNGTGYQGTQSPGSATFVTNSDNTMTVAETMDLPSALLTTIQAGGDSINGFNLEYYPAGGGYSGTSYSVTFNSLVLQSVSVASPLQITSSQYNAATSQITLTWTSQASAQYTIQYSSNLTSGFTPLVTNIASGGSTTTYTATVPAGNAGFFEVFQQ